MAGKKIDLNKADAKELEAIEGIDSRRAQLIIDYREEHGAFESIDEIEDVPGIGPVLTEKVRETLTLSSAPAEEREEIEEEIEPDDLVETLSALAQLDAEAAVAYELGANHIDIDEVRDQLLKYRGDHLRHVRDLNEVIERMGGDRVDESVTPGASSITALPLAVAALGTRAEILAMLANEQLTNSVYQNVLELPLDADLRKLIERNYGDEQRHLKALQELREREWEEERPSA